MFGAMQGCQVTGSVYMTSTEKQATDGVAGASSRDGNTFIAPSAPVYWPVENGPFVCTPDPLAAH